MSAVYDIGTISVTNGSTVVTGAGTSWVGVLRAGWLIKLPNGEMGAIASVVSATQITLLDAYTGRTQTGQDYWAIATGGVASDLVAAITERNADVQAMLDGPGAGRFENGTAAQPGIAFTADQDTGIRRSATNTLAVTTGGVDRAIFGANGMTGPAVQSSAYDNAAGKLLTVGAFGLGDVGAISETNLDLFPQGFAITPLGSDLTALPTGMQTGERAVALTMGSAGAIMQMLWTRSSGRVFFRLEINDLSLASWVELWSRDNTTVDGSGFLLEASPILRVYVDQIEEPNKPVGGSMVRQGAGHYVISGTPPLAAEGWTVRAPRDMNGNEVARVSDLFWHNDELHLHTADATGRAADIPDGHFVMLRFWEAADEDETPPEITQLTAPEVAARVAAMREVYIKAECGARILAVGSMETQMNISQAGIIFAAAILGGAERADALATAGLIEGDLALSEAWTAWVKAMRAECQRAIAEGGDPVWPDVPAGVVDFAARF